MGPKLASFLFGCHRLDFLQFVFWRKTNVYRTLFQVPSSRHRTGPHWLCKSAQISGEAERPAAAKRSKFTNGLRFYAKNKRLSAFLRRSQLLVDERLAQFGFCVTRPLGYRPIDDGARLR